MKEDIERYLGRSSEATAKSIANGTGLPQLDVTKELNRMLGCGTVEREKRAGGGNEYVYWLVRGTLSAAVPRDAASAPAADPSQDALAVAKPTLAEVIASVPPAAIGHIENAQVIADLRAEVERLVAANEALVADAASQISQLQIENAELQQKADTWRANAATLEARIDELTLGPVGARAPLFVTVGRYCKPQRHDSIEKAQKRGRALVRGEKESEVLVLEPVGRIVRGTEWMPR
ncbi:TPA: 1-pyrroline-5-carboxylate dehydrogenase [Burkholderia vietnamiensis]|nr:1-pyrroline-5-carboxylate dehydrogenase [Burkholderia vietnamiensis]